MFRRFFRKDDLLTAGELARRVHSAWLTKALGSRRAYPRIPVKPVTAGGFSELMASPDGPRIAREWWDNALQAVDEESENQGEPGVDGSFGA